MALTNDVESVDVWTEFQQEITSELEQSQRALKEITLMLEQSQIEMNKLTQRNTAITVHLQQVQSQVESLPRADIRMAYDSALDAQQRLFVMRGQLEKLQSDQSYLQRYVSMLEQTQKMLAGDKPTSKQARVNTAGTTLEMVVNAQESERKRLSREMHDGPAQALSNFILQTEIAMRLFDTDAAKAKEELTSLKMAALNTFQKVRNFISELRPMMLDDLGMVPTVKRYVESFKEQTGVDAQMAMTGTERRLEPYLEVMIFRALQELMGNAVRHGQANQIKVHMGVEDQLVKISVDDNGKGFNPEAAAESSGLGLKVIRERIEMLGGSMEIGSVLGQGSTISLQIPAGNLTE